MNAYIERILLFKDNTDKREVKLTPGLNIITGDSKTGKSALIEIVDYCLFSSRSTIPKGIINDWADLFVIVLKISDKYLVIARPNAKNEDGNRAYLRLETDAFFLSNLTSKYCKETESKSIKEAQLEIEHHLGMSVSDTRKDEDDDKRNAGKATLRSFLPFLLQHQGLVANKHSLFYRFDDFYKRKKTIDDFPILIGWESSEYFLLSRELESKKKELKAEEKLIEKLKINDNELKIKLIDLLKSYYKFIGLELDEDLSLADLKKIAKNIPSVNFHSYSDSSLNLELENKKQQRYDLKINLTEKELLIKKLNDNADKSEDYISHLATLNAINSFQEEDTEIVCPICKTYSLVVMESVEAVLNSKNKLIEELSKIGTYNNDCSEQTEVLQKERDDLKRKIDKFSVEIEKLEKQDIIFQKNKPFIEQSLILKGATEARIEYLLEQNNKNNESIDLEKLKNEISRLKEKLAGFDLETKIKEAEIFLSKRMTEICNKLDFEEELKPGKLQFTINNFDFYYHYNEKEKIYLSEMGSGSNWLTCHLSLFIALLHLNCNSKKSSIPSFLIIDQPSQVYFPKEYGKLDEDKDETSKVDENIRQVKNIFKVIADEIVKIQTDCGFSPQIIVMEHADEPEFNTYVKARWKKDKEKLI